MKCYLPAIFDTDMQEPFSALVSLFISLLVTTGVLPKSQGSLFLDIVAVLDTTTPTQQSELTVSIKDIEIATVGSVIDGDTIKLENGQTVRYIGIDTPETKHPTKADECYGKEASRKNTEIVLGKVVRLQKDVSEVDRYGRLLRYVWVGEQLVNEVLVAEGYAVARSYPPDVSLQEQLIQAENTARENKLGLWGNACE